jgi:hypothetical protein
MGLLLLYVLTVAVLIPCVLARRVYGSIAIVALAFLMPRGIVPQFYMHLDDLLLGVVTIIMVVRRPRDRSPVSGLAVLVTIYLILSLLGLFWGYVAQMVRLPLPLVVKTQLKPIRYVLWAIIIHCSLTNIKDIKTFVRGFLVVLLIVFLGVIMHNLGLGVLDAFARPRATRLLDSLEAGTERYSFTLAGPWVVGYIGAVAYCLTIAGLGYGGVRVQIFRVAVAVAALFAIATTRSRLGIICLGVASIYYIVTSKKRVVVMVGLCVISVVFTYSAYGYIESRMSKLGSFDAGDISDRLATTGRAVGAVPAWAVWTGVGVEGSQANIRSHNLYVSTLLATGILGVCFLVMCLVLYVRFVHRTHELRTRLPSDVQVGNIVNGLNGIVVATLAYGFGAAMFSYQIVETFVIVAAVVWCWNQVVVHEAGRNLAVEDGVHHIARSRPSRSEYPVPAYPMAESK